MNPADKGYAFFDHTADVGMRACGDTLEELFVHAAQGLVALLVEESVLHPKETRAVSLTAASVEELLRVWLSQFIVWFDAERFLPAAYQLESVSETALRGTVAGEQFDPQRHMFGVEVKGVTRHAFRVGQTNGRWKASLIFDV